MPIKDLLITVAISREFVCVIDKDRYMSLLTVPINECSWKKFNSTNAQCLSSFFIHFSSTTQTENTSKLLQIFTKQAVMMDALMTSSQEAWRAEDNDNTFADDELLKLEENALSMSEDPLYQTKCNRLCLATFDSEGTCVDAVGSLKMVVDVK